MADLKNGLQTGIKGLAAILLGAGALCLVIFALAVFLGTAAVLLLIAAGFYLSSPEDAKRLLSSVAPTVNGWIAAMRKMMEAAGRSMLAALEKLQGGEKAKHEEAAEANDAACAAPAGNAQVANQQEAAQDEKK